MGDRVALLRGQQDGVDVLHALPDVGALQVVLPLHVLGPLPHARKVGYDRIW